MTHQHNVTIIFGDIACRKYEDAGTVTNEVTEEGNVETFTFKTRDELNAFMEGVEAASGWLDHTVVSDSREEEDAA